MAKKMTRAALFFMIGTVILTAFYKKDRLRGRRFHLAITFGTVFLTILVNAAAGGRRISGM